MMDKQEAYRILSEELRVLAELPFSELEGKLGSTATVNRQDSAGTQYEVEAKFHRDPGSPDLITITGTVVTTGQWHFDPLIEKINVRRD